MQKATVDMAINSKKTDRYNKTALEMAMEASSTVRLKKDTVKMAMEVSEANRSLFSAGTGWRLYLEDLLHIGGPYFDTNV